MNDPITMIDYGGSNMRSAHKGLEAIGATVIVSSDPETVRRADKLVLPGVGAFGAGMENLRVRGLIPAIQEAAAAGTPLLGICVGMQFLFEESEEMGRHAGLGLIPGRVIRFPGPQLLAQGLKVPHMGWNQIDHDGSHPLLAGVPSGTYTYFVHSYYCAPAAAAAVAATASYGKPFAAVVQHGNVYGTQFHPEKSQVMGRRILRNFAAL